MFGLLRNCKEFHEVTAGKLHPDGKGAFYKG
jgi:hypothetical protein